MNTNSILKLLKPISKYFFLLFTLNVIFSCTVNDEISDVVDFTEVNEETDFTEDDEEIEITVVEENDEPTDEITEAESLLILVNELRATEGIPALTLDESLNEAAFAHSNDMFINDYFDHVGLDGSSFSDRVRETGYTGSPVGENIAKGFISVEAVFDGWLNSDGHKDNMLSTRATEMGLGVSGTLWTQLFGSN